MKKLGLIGGLAALAITSQAGAVLMSEVSDNAYISVGGYDIAWAAPCALQSPSCGVIDLSYQAQFGWEMMSEGLFNQLGINAQSFVFDGANVDYASGNNLDEPSGARVACSNSNLQGDVAVAAPWFSSQHLHIDWCNGEAGMWSFADNNGISYSESLVVRVSQAVPEPATLALFGLGLSGLAFTRRRKSA